MRTVYQMITENMETLYPDNVALRYYVDETETVVEKHYGEYAQDIRRAVSWYRENVPGLSGGKICLLAANSYAYAVSCLGVLLTDAVLVPLNQNKSWDELSSELSRVQPVAILWDGGAYPYAEQLKAEYGSKMYQIGCYTECEPAEISERADHDAVRMIMFTSGTTGQSKGVMLSEKNIFASTQPLADIGNHLCDHLGKSDILMSHCTALPLFHIAAFICLFTWTTRGWAINLCELRNFYRDMKIMPSEAMAVVPVILKSIHQDVTRGRRDRLGRLLMPVCSSAMFDPQMLMEMVDNGMYIVQTYGLTETGGAGLINYAHDIKNIGAVGKPNPAFHEVKLMDDGELCIRGDCVMVGYYNDPEATAEVIDADGWFHTGDLGRMNEDGYIFLVGRKKNLIILDSGENISPEELEGLLFKDADIKECIVKEKGNKICAVIYADADKQEAIRQYITETNRTVPLYKRITAVEFSTEPLPRNAAGKLERK